MKAKKIFRGISWKVVALIFIFLLILWKMSIDAQEVTDDQIAKAIQLCVESKRGADYESAREKLLKIDKNKLLLELSKEKKGISITEWVVREALKSWIEKPDIGKKFYNKIPEVEEPNSAAGPWPSGSMYFCSEFGKEALPFMYEVLYKRETHPYVLVGVINALDMNTIEDKKSIAVLIPFLEIEKIQGTEILTVQGIQGQRYVPKGAIWSIPGVAARTLRSLGERFGTFEPIKPLKKLYITSEELKPLEETWKNEDEGRRIFKEGIISAIERIGGKEAEEVLLELEKIEKEDELRRCLIEARQKVIEKQRQKDEKKK